ncbi:MAG: noncanonical pyrimidine nucleotidase, YjjG family [Cyclobacteriaceae bacterium]|nr:noncanonical pyrimidine nucleotidase, YjjG family [Cyclobacteriaceae bacterium]
MKKYSCILFDLDHTLWDYEVNSKETLEALFHSHQLQQKGIEGFEHFFERFTHVNTDLWKLYDKGLIGQEVIRLERFHKVFLASGLEAYELSQKFSDEYLIELPKKENLLPHTKETLQYLSERYPMVIVTNGFEEMQGIKLTSGGIRHYFKNIVTSQRAGDKKPSRKIFDFALAEIGHDHTTALMVGDNLITDIGGARSAGLDTVYFNPKGDPHSEEVTFEVRSLHELKNLL